MKLFVNKLRTLSELYGNQLQMLLSAEEEIAQLMWDMREWAEDEELRRTFNTEMEEAERQLPRIRELLSANGTESKPVKCKVAAALAVETEEMVADTADSIVRDVALITAAQRVKHYEIAVYGTIRNFATILGKSLDAEMLETSVLEEKIADRQLSRIADRMNAQAQGPVLH